MFIGKYRVNPRNPKYESACIMSMRSPNQPDEWIPKEPIRARFTKFRYIKDTQRHILFNIPSDEQAYYNCLQDFIPEGLRKYSFKFSDYLAVVFDKVAIKIAVREEGCGDIVTLTHMPPEYSDFTVFNCIPILYASVWREVSAHHRAGLKIRMKGILLCGIIKPPCISFQSKAIAAIAAIAYEPESVCVVCMDATPTVQTSCGHTCCCTACIELIHDGACPLCRKVNSI